MRPRRSVPVQNAVGEPTAVRSPIALSRHYAKNRLQSLRVDSSAGGTVPELSGHSGTSSHRARAVVLLAANGPNRCASQNSRTILRHSIGQETTDLSVDMDTTRLCTSQNKMHNSGITPIG